MLVGTPSQSASLTLLLILVGSVSSQSILVKTPSQSASFMLLLVLEASISSHSSEKITPSQSKSAPQFPQAIKTGPCKLPGFDSQ